MELFAFPSRSCFPTTFLFRRVSALHGSFHGPSLYWVSRGPPRELLFPPSIVGFLAGHLPPCSMRALGGGQCSFLGWTKSLRTMLPFLFERLAMNIVAATQSIVLVSRAIRKQAS